MTQKKSSIPRMIPHLRTGSGVSPSLKGVMPQSGKKLEIVLKCDSTGTQEAVTGLIAKLDVPGVTLKVIHAGVGDVGKSDLLMALTAGKLVVGFNVGTLPRLDQAAKEHGVEVRIHRVIYGLTEDLKRIAQSLVPPKTAGEEEKITGRAEVIALFKSSHKGIILGCRVLEGILAVGKRYRIIAAMGPVHSGRLESLQVDKKPVQEGKPGQEVGIKIPNFNRAHVGDFVECFEIVPSKRPASWRPSGNILHFSG